MAKTLFDKIWNRHSVSSNPGFPDTLYIDAHIVNKISSPQAFEGLRKRGIPVFRPKQTYVEEPVQNPHVPQNEISKFQLDLLSRNCSDFGLNLPEMNQETRLTDLIFPGQTIVCHESDIKNLGAVGSIVLGIKDLQVEQVLASQCLLKYKPKCMKIEVNGKLARGLSAKDIIHYLISEISAMGAKNYYVEYAGDTITGLNMEGRMAVCSMSGEVGALGGIIAPDRLTLEYLYDLGLLPGGIQDDVTALISTLVSDESSVYDEVLEFDAEDIGPGDYGIGISKLLPSLTAVSDGGALIDDTYRIVESCTDTDYLVSRKEDIEEFERTRNYLPFDGVQYTMLQPGEAN